jgi:hypothetical protein
VAADRDVERDLGGGVVGWRVLAQALIVGRCTPRGHCGRIAPHSSSPAGPGRDLDDVDAFRGEEGVEGVGELGVPVAGSGSGTS